MQVLRQNFEEIQNLSKETVPVNALHAKLNMLFRPLLLDGIAMLDLLGAEQLTDKFRTVQAAFFPLLRMDGGQAVCLADYLPMDDFSAAVEDYARLILQTI